MQAKKIRMIKVPEEWVLSNGAGTRVVVIDSHIDPNSSVFKERVVSYEKLNRERGGGYSHCTSVCNIISAISPLTEIIVIQSIIEKTGTVKGLELALRAAMEYEFDVINLSVSSPASSEGIKSLIKEASLNSMVVCSVPNNGNKHYPCSYEEVISVSSIENNVFKADIYAEDKLVLLGDNTKKTGNSMSTAFVSGICLLARSFDKTLLRDDFLKRLHEI